MNARRRKFVAEYLKEPNATKAAQKAGYSKKSAYSVGQRLLNIPEVRKALQKKLENYELTPERVLRELALLAYANMDDYVDLENGKRVLNTAKPTRDQMAAVSEITEDATGGSGDGERRVVMRTRFKLVDKGINLERLGRHLKLFTDRIELKVEGDLSSEVNAARQAVQRLKGGA